MINTTDLIARLSAEIKPIKKRGSPIIVIARLIFSFVIYGAICQLFLGLRADITEQLMHPFFAIEMALLLLLFISSVSASVFAMYPDIYQRPRFLVLPPVLLVIVGGMMCFQLFLLPDTAMTITKEVTPHHTIECILCIAIITIFPSALLFFFVRKGASTKHYHAGFFTVLTATSMACFILRLAEQTNSIVHILQFHYAPIILFAMIGALLGKWLLRW